MIGRTGATKKIDFRAEGPDDQEVVRHAHMAHRAAVFAQVDWPPDALHRLCQQQHDLQERHIAIHNPLAERRMIVVGKETVGRLCLDRTMAIWRIVDVALLPHVQGRGYGGTAIRRVLVEAAAAGADVDLMVDRGNPRAEALYRRLGFADAIHGSATHRRLLWSV